MWPTFIFEAALWLQVLSENHKVQALLWHLCAMYLKRLNTIIFKFSLYTTVISGRGKNIKSPVWPEVVNWWHLWRRHMVAEFNACGGATRCGSWLRAQQPPRRWLHRPKRWVLIQMTTPSSEAWMVDMAETSRCSSAVTLTWSMRKRDGVGGGSRGSPSRDKSSVGWWGVTVCYCARGPEQLLRTMWRQ